MRICKKRLAKTQTTTTTTTTTTTSQHYTGKTNQKKHSSYFKTIKYDKESESFVSLLLSSSEQMPSLLIK